METIRADILNVLETAGMTSVDVVTVHSPAWTTDWMTDDARSKLEAFGIAPPAPDADEEAAIRCPQCRAPEPTTVSIFGSTACKALLVCSSCGEPFDYFKAI